MKRALSLASKARGEVGHYPKVGALVIKGGRVVGEGYFKGPGEPHAEVVAIRRAGKNAKGASLVLNLEPCCHFGRTPPCTATVIGSGIKCVVAGMEDPNPLVCGGGFRELKKAGIKVISGILEKECRELNRHFIKYITSQLPFVILKLAATLDGKIATRNSKSRWITGESSRRLVHELRSNAQVVMVGKGTVIKDDPELSVKLLRNTYQPRPLVVSSKLNIPLSSRFLSTPAKGGAIIACTELAPSKRIKNFEAIGAEIIVVKANSKGEVDLKDLMKKLGERKIASVLLEGGARLSGSALDDQVVDHIMIFFAPKIIGDEKARSMVEGRKVLSLGNSILIEKPEVRWVGEDLLVEGTPKRF